MLWWGGPGGLLSALPLASGNRQALHRLFHHLTSGILACLIPPLCSCPLWKPAQPNCSHSEYFFFLCLVSFFPSCLQLCMPAPCRAPLPTGQSPAAAPARESNCLHRLPRCAAFPRAAEHLPHVWEAVWKVYFCHTLCHGYCVAPLAEGEGSDCAL